MGTTVLQFPTFFKFIKLHTGNGRIGAKIVTQQLHRKQHIYHDNVCFTQTLMPHRGTVKNVQESQLREKCLLAHCVCRLLILIHCQQKTRCAPIVMTTLTLKV